MDLWTFYHFVMTLKCPENWKKLNPLLHSHPSSWGKPKENFGIRFLFLWLVLNYVSIELVEPYRLKVADFWRQHKNDTLMHYSSSTITVFNTTLRGPHDITPDFCCCGTSCWGWASWWNVHFYHRFIVICIRIQIIVIIAIFMKF